MRLSKLNPMGQTAEIIYLDWKNNFLTPERFADYYSTNVRDVRIFLKRINKQWGLNNGW